MGRQGWSSCFPSQTLGCWHSLGQEGLGWDRLHQGWWLHRTLAFKVPPRNLHSSSSLSLTRDARIPLLFLISCILFLRSITLHSLLYYMLFFSALNLRDLSIGILFCKNNQATVCVHLFDLMESNVFVFAKRGSAG
jgi:hypothetical protein